MKRDADHRLYFFFLATMAMGAGYDAVWPTCRDLCLGDDGDRDAIVRGNLSGLKRRTKRGCCDCCESAMYDTSPVLPLSDRFRGGQVPWPPESCDGFRTTGHRVRVYNVRKCLLSDACQFESARSCSFCEQSRFSRLSRFLPFGFPLQFQGVIFPRYGFSACYTKKLEKEKLP